MIHYSFPLYRPPAEADNMIIQATLGCSHNRCSFCTMYKTKRYTVRPLNEVCREIEALAYAYPNANKVEIHWHFQRIISQSCYVY